MAFEFWDKALVIYCQLASTQLPLSAESKVNELAYPSGGAPIFYFPIFIQSYIYTPPQEDPLLNDLVK